MGDESDKTRELCKREDIEKVPHFSFDKSMEKIHEEEIGPDELVGDILYHGNNYSTVAQLHCREDVEKLIGDHKVDHKLVVLDVGLKHCGPCGTSNCVEAVKADSRCSCFCKDEWR